MLKRIIVGGLSLTAAGLISIATWEGFKDEAYIPVPTLVSQTFVAQP